MKLTLRKANTDDVKLIRNLAARIWEPSYGKILSKEQLEFMFDMMYSEEHITEQMTLLEHIYFIASADDVPCAYISIEKANESERRQNESNVLNRKYIFQKIYCLPQLQGKGIGRFLVNEAIDYLKSVNNGNPFDIELYVNRENPAVRFYEHIGFVKVDTRDYHIGNGYYMNDYIMLLKIQ